jgi:hypothetical protein
MNSVLFAKGAYGRPATREDWEDGKDFRCVRTGQYFSKRDVGYLQKLGVILLIFLSPRGVQAFTLEI